MKKTNRVYPKGYVRASNSITASYSVRIASDDGELFESLEFDSLDEALQYAKEENKESNKNKWPDIISVIDNSNRQVIKKYDHSNRR